MIKSFTQELSRELREIFREPDWIVEGELNWSGNNEDAVAFSRSMGKYVLRYTIDTEDISSCRHSVVAYTECQENKDPTDEWEKDCTKS